LSDTGARPGLYQAEPMLDPPGFAIGHIAIPVNSELKYTMLHEKSRII
jgi:hypothetical protein